MRKFLTFSTALVAASLFLLPSAAHAQKALVYCPPTDGATCATLVTTLSAAGAYPGGVDRAFDGTSGSVDLKTADLFAYTVFFVPSLADGEAGTPYALLRDATVATRLRAALIGRRALWSGTPDLGASNRDKKNALIANLASWAGAKFATVQGPGLVVLQDNSDNDAAQYNWVNGLLGVSITSDHDPKSYASVRTISAAGVAIVTSNGASLAYENMASYGFYLPDGAPGISLDAVGQTGTAVGGEVVLITSEGANTGGATIKTDKNDYAPGTTVVMTGAGFGAGEAVTLTLHEDPQVHEDRTFSATADANGAFTFSGFAPEEHHIGVRFVLTAVGQASGKRAQTTFTDGNADFVGKVTSAATGTAISGATVTVSCSAGCGSGTVVTTGVTDGSGNYSIKVNYSGNGAITASISVSASGFASQGVAASSYTSGSNTTRNFALVGAQAATTLQTDAATADYGGTVTLTATLRSPNGAGSGVSGKTITFVLNSIAVGSAVTNGLGIATLANASVVGIPAGIYPAANSGVTATFAGDGSHAASSGVNSLTVNKAPLTISVASLSRLFNQPNPAFTGTVIGAVSGDVITATYATAATQGSPVGTYPITATIVDAGSKIGNYVVSNTPGTLTINKASQTIIFAQPASVTYGDIGVQVTATTTANLPVAFSGTGACTITSGGAANVVSLTSAGTCTVTATQPGDANYEAAPSVDRLVTVAPRSISVGSVSVSDKPYDGNTTATITARTLAVGVINNDVVELTGGTASFGDKNVGIDKPVTVTGLALDGANAMNYTLAAALPAIKASITALTVTPVVTIANKQYDGTNAATIATSSVAGAIAGETVTLTGGMATFDNENVGTGKTVSITGLGLGGAGSGNYLLSSSSASATANITARSVTIGTVTIADKIYDGTTNATITTRTLSAGGVLGTDVVSLTGGTALFADKAAGAGKTVNITGLSLDGADAGNYSLGATSASSSAAITQKSATASITASNKEYDGTATATAMGSAAGTISGDAVTVEVTGAAFDSPSVGSNKPVTATVALGGADAGNYTLRAATIASTTANITAKALTLGAIAASNKVYDGTTTATLTSGPAVTGVLGSDVVTLTGGSVTFADKNVGNGKTVTATGYTLDGAAAGNYTLLLTASSTTTAHVTAATITGSSISAAGKVYDGLRDAQVTGTLGSGKIGGDGLTLVVGNAKFDTKDVGVSKTVTADLSLSGADVLNYVLASQTASTTAAITAKPITGSFTANNKVYDATTAATVLASSLPGVIAPDVVTLSVSDVAFASKQVGSGKAVSANLALTGAQAGNYSVNLTAMATADITPATINGSFTASNKIYDGTTTATILTRSIGTGLLQSDQVTLNGGSATFADKNVGNGKTVTGSGFTLGGADGSNYNLAAVPITTANITAAATATTVSPVTASEGATSLTLAAQIKTASGVPITVVDEGTVMLVVTRNATTVPAVPATVVGTFTNLAVSAGAVSRTVNFGTDLVDPVASSAGYSITATFTPALNYSASNGTGIVTVTNAAPVISSVTATATPTATNASFNVTAKFNDAGLATDDYVASVTFTAAGLATQPLTSSCSINTVPQDAGSTAAGCTITKPTSAGSDGTLAINRSFATAGVYKVVITIRDRAGLNDVRTVENFLVVFDPAGGFVTGGGWIDSPEGAFLAKPTLFGKANFGFVSKYQKGNTLPSGNTEFQFKAGDMNFKSTVYQWLVIAGARAQYKGDGTINGSGQYGFLLTAIDGQENGGGGVDKFRIKIWDKNNNNAVVYDNQVGSSDLSDSAAPSTALGGGSIQIQSK